MAHILVVDDEPAVAKALKSLLEIVGFYEVTTCEDGKSALDVFTKEEGKIDLVITDYQMPGMNGLELTEKIREKNPEITIIMVTGTPPSFSEGGPNAIFGKPFNPGPLMDYIRRALACKKQ